MDKESIEIVSSPKSPNTPRKLQRVDFQFKFKDEIEEDEDDDNNENISSFEQDKSQDEAQNSQKSIKLQPIPSSKKNQLLVPKLMKKKKKNFDKSDKNYDDL